MPGGLRCVACSQHLVVSLQGNGRAQKNTFALSLLNRVSRTRRQSKVPLRRSVRCSKCVE